MSEDLAFDCDRPRFIETRGPDDKGPKRSWGGYNQDFDAADHVYTHDDLQKVPHENWVVVDTGDINHASLALLVFDLDVYKAALHVHKLPSEWRKRWSISFINQSRSRSGWSRTHENRLLHGGSVT